MAVNLEMALDRANRELEPLLSLYDKYEVQYYDRTLTLWRKEEVKKHLQVLRGQIDEWQLYRYEIHKRFEILKKLQEIEEDSQKRAIEAEARRQQRGIEAEARRQQQAIEVENRSQQELEVVVKQAEIEARLMEHEQLAIEAEMRVKDQVLWDVRNIFVPGPINNGYERFLEGLDMLFEQDIERDISSYWMLVPDTVLFNAFYMASGLSLQKVLHKIGVCSLLNTSYLLRLVQECIGMGNWPMGNWPTGIGTLNTKFELIVKNGCLKFLKLRAILVCKSDPWFCPFTVRYILATCGRICECKLWVVGSEKEILILMEPFEQNDGHELKTRSKSHLEQGVEFHMKMMHLVETGIDTLLSLEYVCMFEEGVDELFLIDTYGLVIEDVEFCRDTNVVISTIPSCITTLNYTVTFGTTLVAQLGTEPGGVTKYITQGVFWKKFSEQSIAISRFGCNPCFGYSGITVESITYATSTCDYIKAYVPFANQCFVGQIHVLTRAKYFTSRPLVDAQILVRIV